MLTILSLRFGDSQNSTFFPSRMGSVFPGAVYISLAAMNVYVKT